MKLSGLLQISNLKCLGSLLELSLAWNEVRKSHSPLLPILASLSICFPTVLYILMFMINLSSLHQIDQSMLQINCIQGLESLVTLERLDLSHNKISHVTNLSCLICLATVNLSGNLISSLGSFQEFSKVGIYRSNKGRVSVSVDMGSFLPSFTRSCLYNYFAYFSKSASDIFLIFDPTSCRVCAVSSCREARVRMQMQV